MRYLTYIKKLLWRQFNRLFFAQLGKGSYFQKGILRTSKYIYCGEQVRVGRNCRIEGVTQYNNVSFQPQIILKNNVSIQQNLHLTCASKIEIGKNTAIAANVTITDIHHPFDLPVSNADFFISMESIEHIENDKLFLDTICKALKSNGILILSTPNIEKWQPDKHHFHYRHYKPSEFIERLSSLHLKLLHFYGQDIYKMDTRGKIIDTLEDKDMALHVDYKGQNCVFIFQKIK